MARPKRARFIDGVELEENLYADNKGRKGHYRYLKPDGTGKFFTADSVHQANAAARKANREREGYSAYQTDASIALTMMGGYIESFIQYRENLNPSLQTKASWRNRCYQLRQFGKSFTLPFSQITRQHIHDWWENLTHYQQKARHAEFRRLFNYLMSRNLLPKLNYNPFTTSDERPRLYLNEQPMRTRMRMNLDEFWNIYEAAGELGYEGLQVAMGISLTTFMRQEDILKLRIDEHIEGHLLKRVIQKSAAQKGMTKAARRQWDTRSYPLLGQLIQKGRLLSMRNDDCPYLISHMPTVKRVGKTKDHVAQITPKRLQDMFTEARDKTGLWERLGENTRAPTFHECRSLADKIASEAGYDIDTIQHAMAHSDKSQSLLYQANHDLPFEEVNIIFDTQVIGRNFCDVTTI